MFAATSNEINLTYKHFGLKINTPEIAFSHLFTDGRQWSKKS